MNGEAPLFAEKGEGCVEASTVCPEAPSVPAQREYFMARIHFTIVMIKWTGLAPEKGEGCVEASTVCPEPPSPAAHTSLQFKINYLAEM